MGFGNSGEETERGECVPENGGVLQFVAADEELGLHVGDARLQAALLLLLAHELAAALLQRRDGRQLVCLRAPLLLFHL